MANEVEYTDEFEKWWISLSEDEQDDVAATVSLLEAKGPVLPFPYSSGISGSKHSHARTPYTACWSAIQGFICL